MKWIWCTWAFFALGVASVGAQELPSTAPSEQLPRAQALKLQRLITAGRDQKAVALLKQSAAGTLWCDLSFDAAIAEQLRADIGVLARRQKQRDQAWACVDYGLHRDGGVHRAAALYEASKLVRTANKAEFSAAITHATATQQQESKNDQCIGDGVSISPRNNETAFVFDGPNFTKTQVSAADALRFLQVVHPTWKPTPVTQVVCLLRVVPMLNLSSWQKQRRFVADGLVAAAASHAPKPVYLDKLSGSKPPLRGADVLGVVRLVELKSPSTDAAEWTERLRCWSPARPDEFPTSCAKATSLRHKPNIRRINAEVQVAHVRWETRPDSQSSGALNHDAVFIEAQGRLFKLEGGVGSSLGNYGDENTSRLHVGPDHFAYEYIDEYHDAGTRSETVGYWLCGTVSPIRCLKWQHRAGTLDRGPYNNGWSWIPSHADAARHRAAQHSWTNEHSFYEHPAPVIAVRDGKISLGSPTTKSAKHRRRAAGVFHSREYDVLHGLTLEEAFNKVEDVNARTR